MLLSTNKYQILWLDCRFDKSKKNIKDELNEAYNIDQYGIYFFDHYESHAEIIAYVAPKLICFDFDLPDEERLAILQKIKLDFPKIPIIMLSNDHSIDLAIWALRVRVWDYFIKPIALKEINHSLKVLLKQVNKQSNNQSIRKVISPSVKIPKSGRSKTHEGMKTHSTISYIKQNLCNKITVSHLAA